jgi:hypothetical protein
VVDGQQCFGETYLHLQAGSGGMQQKNTDVCRNFVLLIKLMSRCPQTASKHQLIIVLKDKITVSYNQ